MKCPSCRNDLSNSNIDGVEVEKCTACKGVLLDKGKLDSLVDPKEKMTELTTVDHDPGIHSDSHPPRECPHCQIEMKKVNLLDEDCDIIYDYCEACKCFWLDNGEIEKTKKYIEEHKEPHAPSLMYFSNYLNMKRQIPWN